jgi:hypothetical protein
MIIHFRSRQNTRFLCLMQAQNNGSRPGSLVFDFSPRRFLGCRGTLFFKFVYLRQADRLIVGDHDLKHRKIAEGGLGRHPGRGEVIGAFLEYQEKNGSMRFTIYGKSGYFGQPIKKHLRQVAVHIAARLDSPLITEGDRQIVIQGHRRCAPHE